MAAIKNLNPKAEIARNHQALAINISAARGLRDVMKTNLGPKVKKSIDVCDYAPEKLLEYVFLVPGLSDRNLIFREP